MNKKPKGQSLDSILAKEMASNDFRIQFDQARFYLQVAHLIADLRARSGYSQAELAKKSHVSQPLIARLEKGDPSRAPTFDTIFKVLKVLGYTLSIHVKADSKRAA